MGLICTPSIDEKIVGNNIVIDTCVIIESSKNVELDLFLNYMREKGSTFLSLPSVKDEFTCGANNLEEYRELSDYFDRQDILLLPKCEEKLLSDDGIKFNIALKRSKVRNPSYVDRSLLFIPYLYTNPVEKPYIMTSNHRDIPREFYDLAGFVSYEKDGFHSIGVYEFNEDKFNKAVGNL